MKASLVPFSKISLLAPIGVEYSKVVALILVIPANIDVAILLVEAHATPRPFAKVAYVPLALAGKLAEPVLAAV